MLRLAAFACSILLILTLARPTVGYAPKTTIVEPTTPDTHPLVPAWGCVSTTNGAYSVSRGSSDISASVFPFSNPASSLILLPPPAGGPSQYVVATFAGNAQGAMFKCADSSSSVPGCRLELVGKSISLGPKTPPPRGEYDVSGVASIGYPNLAHGADETCSYIAYASAVMAVTCSTSSESCSSVQTSVPAPHPESNPIVSLTSIPSNSGMTRQGVLVGYQDGSVVLAFLNSPANSCADLSVSKPYPLDLPSPIPIETNVVASASDNGWGDIEIVAVPFTGQDTKNVTLIPKSPYGKIESLVTSSSSGATGGKSLYVLSEFQGARSLSALSIESAQYGPATLLPTTVKGNVTIAHPSSYSPCIIYGFSNPGHNLVVVQACNPSAP